MNITWIGPVVAPYDVERFPGISPAANSWQLRCMELLKKQCQKLTLISYIPSPIWPKGQLLPKYQFPLKISDSYHECHAVSYLNIIQSRELFLADKIRSQLARLAECNKQYPDWLITYNALPRHVTVGEFVKKRGTRWISIVADEWAHGSPDLTIFLSYNYYSRFSGGNKLLFEGRVKPYVECPVIDGEKKILLYSGSFSIWTGIIQFAELFKELNPNGFELHVYGKDLGNQLKPLLGGNVRYKGFVSGEELDEACKQAYAFVNPRPINVVDGDNNFPSKLLDYLAYGKPIISTYTKGIPPEYKEVVFYYEDNTTKGLNRIFQQLDALTWNDLSDVKYKIKDFITKKERKNLYNQILDAFN